MFNYSRTHRQLDHNKRRKELIHERNLPEIRMKAEENWNVAYKRKHGNISCVQELHTQMEYINKYFAYNRR